jgi:hypothetical protein
VEQVFHAVFRQPGAGFFDGVAVGDAVERDHGADCPRCTDAR